MVNLTKVVAPVFQKWIDDPNTLLPELIGIGLTPVIGQLGELKVIHPTTNDPVLVSSRFGPIVIWFKL